MRRSQRIRLRRIHEKQHQRSIQQDDDSSGDHVHNKGNQHALPHAVLDPVELFRSQVLPRIGGDGKPQGKARLIRQSLHPAGGAEPGNAGRTEAVDHRLQNNAADGNNGILQRHGDPQADELLLHGKIELPVFLLRL